MYDPKFEKEVQQRMEELEFSPSEAVWIRLQGELHKQKRRPAPLFWLFFLLGGMLLGAGGTYLVVSHGRSGASRVNANTGAFNSSAGNKPALNKSTANGSVANGSAAQVGAANESVAKGVTTNEFAANGSAAKGGAANPLTANHAASNEAPVLTDPQAVAVTTERARPAGRFDGDIASYFGAIPLSVRRPGARDLYQPENKTAVRKARLTRKPSWEAGFTGGAGPSSVSMTGPLSSAAPNPPFASARLPVPSLAYLNNPYGTMQVVQVSPAQPGLSFLAGIFVQKPVFRRLSLTVGMNLHYYSTRLQTGQKVASTVPANAASLFTQSAYVQSLSPAAPYYPPGVSYDYTNRYYFLEIPVSLQWQFNHSRKAPLFWEGGLSLSRLVSSDALYFNEKTGVYDEDRSVANPTQLMAFTSVMIGLNWRGNLIQIGPQGQYGLSSLLNGSAAAQHLLYGGIRIMVRPRRG